MNSSIKRSMNGLKVIERGEQDAGVGFLIIGHGHGPAQAQLQGPVFKRDEFQAGGDVRSGSPVLSQLMWRTAQLRMKPGNVRRS
jgi:hypothetical protein